MKATVYSIEGKVLKQIDLPRAFEAKAREDLIKRAVLSEESKLYQPKGSFKFAGLETSARYRGRKEDFGAVKNKGIPHLPHEVLPKGQLGKVKRVPHSVKGRRAHPPKPEKIIVERMNKKEYRKALIAALAMSADRSIVAARCHEDIGVSIPIVLEDAFEKLSKTRDVAAVFESLKLGRFLDKARKTGTKSPLLVVRGGTILKAARNLPGVDVVTAEKLQVRHLAPGTHAGRITLFSESAIGELGERLSGD